MVLVETLLTFATEKVGETLLSGISAQLNPDDIETFLKQAIKAANAKDYPQGLFDKFEADGRQGYGPFLNQFFQGRARAELQKPLVGNEGSPDVKFLAEALVKEAANHPKLKALDDSLSFSFGGYGEVSNKAAKSLIALGKRFNQVEPALATWIEHHQSEKFVEKGIDTLWELVS